MAEGKYGEILVERGSFHEGEPLFLLRAQDVCALDALFAYRASCARFGCTAEFLASLDAQPERFRAWQAANPELLKVPD